MTGKFQCLYFTNKVQTCQFSSESHLGDKQNTMLRKLVLSNICSQVLAPPRV